jgi:hypothetical protein
MQSCLEFLDGGEEEFKLKLELAVAADVGIEIVRATYNVECNGCQVLRAFNEIQRILVYVRRPPTPSADALLRERFGPLPADDDEEIAKYRNMIQEMLQPLQAFIVKKFSMDGQLSRCIAVIKVARLCDPGTVSDLNVDRAQIDELVTLMPLFPNGTAAALEGKLPAYLTQAAGTLSSCDPIDWWRRHAEELLHWYKATRHVLHLCTSSAASERVFSLFNAVFGDQQYHALEDYIQSTMFAMYNDRNNNGYGLVEGKLTL